MWVDRFWAILALLLFFPTLGMAEDLSIRSAFVSTPSKVSVKLKAQPKYLVLAQHDMERVLTENVNHYLNSATQQKNYTKFSNGALHSKEIAITFDDGPYPDYTPRLLEILKQYKIKATFFPVGKMAEKYPELIRMMEAQGHLVGNHTYSHHNLNTLSVEHVAVEIKACGYVIRDILGKEPYVFRPPGGDYNDDVVKIAGALGYATILWTDNPGDYMGIPSRSIALRTLSRITNGGIILLHDGTPATQEALPEIFKTLQSNGYRFVTVDELLKIKNVASKPKS